jgi:hypothetical protein
MKKLMIAAIALLGICTAGHSQTTPVAQKAAPSKMQATKPIAAKPATTAVVTKSETATPAVKKETSMDKNVPNNGTKRKHHKKQAPKAAKS